MKEKWAKFLFDLGFMLVDNGPCVAITRLMQHNRDDTKIDVGYFKEPQKVVSLIM